MKVACPYCTREIPPGRGSCPSCGTDYDLDTRSLLKMLAEEAPEEYPEERRTYIRTTKVEKVELSTPRSYPDLCLQSLENISLGGLFIKTDTPLKKGERFYLQIGIPEYPHDVKVLCEVAWSQGEEAPAASDGIGPSGMGVRFLNLTREDMRRIVGILTRSLEDRDILL